MGAHFSVLIGQQKHRQVTVGLQVFNRLLARAQCGHLSLQGCDIPDLGIKTGDLALQQLIFPLLGRDLSPKSGKHQSSNQPAQQRSQT